MDVAEDERLVAEFYKHVHPLYDHMVAQGIVRRVPDLMWRARLLRCVVGAATGDLHRIAEALDAQFKAYSSYDFMRLEFTRLLAGAAKFEQRQRTIDALLSQE